MKAGVPAAAAASLSALKDFSDHFEYGHSESNNIFPNRSLFDTNNINLHSNDIGRFGGPIFPQSLIVDLGQMDYVACQGRVMASALIDRILLASSI